MDQQDIPGIESRQSISLPMILGQDSKELKTQEYILKSPSVLLPVYNFVKNYSQENDLEFNNISYKQWLESSLEISFTKNTNILSVSFFNKDKDFILKVLKQISEQYKSYSKKERDKKIDNALFYLESQKLIYKDKSKSSLKKLNSFY